MPQREQCRERLNTFGDADFFAIKPFISLPVAASFE
jgi:hypothetical protein